MSSRSGLCVGLLGLVGAAGLAGCGSGVITTSSSSELAMRGQVHGGDQPVSGSTVGLYAVGTGGNGSQATSLLTSPVVTDRYGSFTLTGQYTCPSASSQVYLVARGGNPGLPGNVHNGALVLLSALGSCGNLGAGTLIYVNEVSTVAAGYALAPFMTAYDHVGASATNSTGIANAFLDARLLADPATGRATSLPLNLAVERDKLLALADALASCVNSDGGAGCAPLFAAATPRGGVAPTDTLGALVNIVKHPANNVAAVFSCISPTPPYATGLSSAPNDWTMSLTVMGGGLDEPTGLGIDRFGDVWAANFGDPGAAGLVAFSSQGTAFAGSPFGVGLQTDAYGLTIDKNGDVWVPSSGNLQVNGGYGSVAKFQGASAATPGTLVGQFSDSTLGSPQSIASDPAGSGTVLLGNYFGGTVTIYDLHGSFLNNLGQGFAAFPDSVTSDGAGGAWVADQSDQNILHLLAGGVVQQVGCCDYPSSVKLDRHGNVWAGNNDPGAFGAYTFSEVAPNGAVLLPEQSGGGLNEPMGTAIDAGGQFWVANEISSLVGYGSISEIAGNDTSVAAGTALSPAGGLGLDAAMLEPYAIAADASGNLWVTDESASTLVMFFGLATPTATPATPVPAAP